MVTRAFAKKNHLGFWVGWLEYADGKTAAITNAFDSKQRALDVAEQVKESANNPRAGTWKEVAE